MKKKETGDKLIVFVFVVVICLAWFWWLLFKNFADTENHENRYMAEFPTLSSDTYLSFSDGVNAYIDDRIPFRNELITINDAIDYYVFKRSSSKNVVIGSDNWLFYSEPNDVDPILSYQGKDIYSEEELKSIAQNCIKQRDIMRDQGREFVIFIAVNKEHVYGEHMPLRYGPQAEYFGALQVYEYLKKNTDVRVVFPYEEMLKAKESTIENIYYKADTHWNYLGGYVAAAALLRELGIDMPDVHDEGMTIEKGVPTSGDLAEMLNMDKMLSKVDNEYYVHGYDEHNMKEEQWDYYNTGIYHSENADPRKVYVIRDSFATHLAPYIGSQFNDCMLRHRDTYDPNELMEYDPDVVIYELSERFCGILEGFKIVR